MDLIKKTSFFEKLLLLVGLFILVIGYFLINGTYIAEGRQVSWEMLQTVFLWLLIAIFIILLALAENIRETIMLRQLRELREIKAALKVKRK